MTNLFCLRINCTEFNVKILRFEILYATLRQGAERKFWPQHHTQSMNMSCLVGCLHLDEMTKLRRKTQRVPPKRRDKYTRTPSVTAPGISQSGHLPALEMTKLCVKPHFADSVGGVQLTV